MRIQLVKIRVMQFHQRQLKNCPSMQSGKSKMNLLKRFPNQNSKEETWRLF
jgi:hypothetical protein